MMPARFILEKFPCRDIHRYMGSKTNCIAINSSLTPKTPRHYPKDIMCIVPDTRHGVAASVKLIPVAVPPPIGAVVVPAGVNVYPARVGVTV